MIFLIYGDDDFLGFKQYQSLKKNYEEVVFWDISLLKEKGVSLVFSSQGFLFSHKVLQVIEGVLSGKVDSEISSFLEEAISRSQGGQDILFWQRGPVDSRRKLVKLLKDKAKVFEFPLMKRPQVVSWIKEELKSFHYESCLIDLLFDAHGNDLWIIHQDLQKIKSLSADKEIKTEIVEQIISRTVQENVFEFAEVVSLGKKKLAVKLFDHLLMSGQDINFLFSMIVRQYRLLILSFFPQGLKGVHPFVVGKIKQQNKFWIQDNLLKVYADLLRIDQESKMGETDLEEEVWLLIANGGRV